MNENTSMVGTTVTTIRVIEALQELDGAGVSEIAERVDIPTSTAFDHLRTLEGHEFVVKRGDQYEIGTRFLEIGGRARSADVLYRTAEPELRELAHETGEHANLMIEEFGRGVFLIKKKGGNAFNLDTHVGKRVTLQTTALGKAILSERSDEYIDEVVDRHGLPAATEETITDRTTLFEEIDEVRQRGFAVDDEERLPGVRCVAAPIAPSSVARGAISISGAKTGMQDKRFNKELPELVLHTANIIEVNIRHQ